MKKYILVLLFFISFFSFSQVPSKIPAGSSLSQKQGSNGSVYYEIFVRSFCDSNEDGIGDLNGITSKLDYLKALGIEGIWLTPIFSSPSYHKYDVTNYMDIDPTYGSLADLKNLVKEAHERNIRVILDLVLNHTSIEHPWFQSSVNDKNSFYQNYYVWAPSADSVTNWYIYHKKRYYAFFSKSMPDLNLDNSSLREQIYMIGRFWLRELDVDGFRLDAAKHIYREEESDKNYAWWESFYKEMKKIKSDFYLIGEVWDSGKKVAPYFKGIPANFNFELSNRLARILEKEQDSALIDYVINARRMFAAVNPNFIDATFLSNHDLNRIATTLNNNIGKIKLAASILFTLPGSPYIYYGEELGMLGKKPDEYIREPFPWSSDKESGTTSWMQPKYNTARSVKSLFEQKLDTTSIFFHYEKMIRLRNQNPVLKLGEIEKVNSSDSLLLVFARVLGKKKLIVVHNLSTEPRSFSLTGISKIYFSTDPSVKKINQQCTIPPFGTIIIE